MPEIENGCRTLNRKMVVSDEAVPFVARGGMIFPNQVTDADPEIQAGEDVLIVDKRDRTLTTARVVLTPDELARVHRNLAPHTAG